MGNKDFGRGGNLDTIEINYTKMILEGEEVKKYF